MGNRRGFALAAAMMVLAVISVMGTAGIESATLEIQLSARDRDARQALCVAQAALEEARSYASRGWGKIVPSGINQVRVASLSPPGLPWSDNRYAGFTLVDQSGSSFTVVSHTDSPSPTIHVSGGTPAEGRFLLLRSGFLGTWQGGSLAVVDDGWALASSVDTWAGWLLWNGAGRAWRVTGSRTRFEVGKPGQVLLGLSSDPGPGPYVLSLHPWLSALASGKASLAGDFDSPRTPERWDRAFTADGITLGSASITATWSVSGQYADTYRLSTVATAGRSSCRASFRVYRPGRTDQQVRDWTVE
ncbi:MAG: hypothetical protein HY900_18875 [Deltaproteobacteria bacterium]|nr:hypothetical protein [Deltaproteobacteria bacterium]